MDNGLIWFLPLSLGSCGLFHLMSQLEKASFCSFPCCSDKEFFFLNIMYQELIFKSAIKFLTCVKEMLFSILL